VSQFLMPSLGADMEAGKLVEWLKQPGEAVHRGDIVAVVETQKGAIEIEIFEDGILDRYLVDLGATVPVGTPLAEVRREGEAPAVAPTPVRPPAEAASARPPEPPSPAVAPPPVPEAASQPAAVAQASKLEMPATEVRAMAPQRPGARQRITPAARRRAARAGVDLATLHPGSTGAITLREVEARMTAPTPSPQAAMREAIAAAMSRSKREIPHYYLAQETDMTAVEAFVAEANTGRTAEERLLPGAFYLKAVALALAKFKEFNGHFEDGTFRASKGVHAGMAVALRGGGLVAPAIFDAETLAVDDVMVALRDRVARARGARLRARELSEGTITVTSLGDRGVDGMFPVIYPPQVAIVGIGTPRERPWVVDGAVVPRRIATLTLAADHRVSDGHRGALFLRAIDALLQTPEAL
jgi:pyruvate dehydrogenase E2 component (dihydrolipoamide acetyltransferase)